MFDSHCHLDLDAFEGDRAAAVARAWAAGIRGLLIAGVDPDGWAAQSTVARAFDGIWVSYGVHPQVVATTGDAEAEAMVTALAAALDASGDDALLAAPKALGETGLDRSPHSPPGSLERQEWAFRQQLRLARRHDLPVVLHILRAHERALAVLEDEGLPEAGGVVHSYSGSAELVPRYVDLGLHVSMAGTVTRPGARRPRLAAAAIPLDRLLVETDAPDQTPSPRRPQRNEPAWLGLVVDAVAEARGAHPQDIAQITEANARRLYRLDPPSHAGHIG